jgi:ABC-2 type transport system permease protein
MIRAYIYQARNALRTETIYPARVFWSLLEGAVLVLPQVFLWRALYIGKEQVAGTSLAQMLTYVVLSNLVGMAVNFSSAAQIEERVKNGTIALDMLRPVNIRLLIIAQNLGTTAGQMLTFGLPMLLVSIVIVGGILSPVSWAAFGYFCLSTLLGMGVQIAIQLFMGALAFWFVSTWMMSWWLDFATLVLSGMVVPLWFLPGWMVKIAQVLPFQAARYIPLAVYLGKIPLGEVAHALIIQVLWIIGLMAAHTILWRSGLRRMVVHGG